MTRPLLPAALLALALFALPAAAASYPDPSEAAYSDPAQVQTEAYIRLAQADQALDDNRLDDARAAYSDALALYSSLASDFPDFSPAVVSYRSAYCRNQLATIAERTGAASPVAAAEPAPAPEPPPVSAADRAKNRENTAHEREVAFLREQIASLQADLASADQAQETLSRQNADLRAENTRLQAKLDTRADISVADLKQLRTDFEFAKTQIAALRRDVEASQSLNDALNDAEAQTASLRARVTRLEEENSLLSEEADDLELQLADAQARLRAAESRAPAAPSQPAQPAPSPAEPVVVPSGDAASGDAASSRVEIVETKPAEPARPAAYAPRSPARPIPEGTAPAAFVRELLAAGDDDSALATVRAARAAAPSDINLALLEGIALIRLEAYDDAITLLIPLSRDNPKHAEIRANLGAAMMGARDYDEARETLEAAVKLDKRLADAHYNLALLYANTAPIRLKDAKKHYKQALDLGLDPDPSLEATLK
jgi:tetratricopeptide (TPR) repeat protein